MKIHSSFLKNVISLITLFFIVVNAYAQPNPTTLPCGVSGSQSLTANGYTGSNATAATGSCGQCCYQGSDLDGDGDQEVSFSVENSKWYRYCNPSGTAITIDFIVDEVNNDCNIQGAVFVTAGTSSSGATDALDIDCSNQEYQEFGSNVSGNADGFSFTGITIPVGGCAWIMVDGYGGATCGAFTINTVCPPACTVPTTFTAGLDITICEGSSGTINSTVSGGLISGPGLVYSWLPTTGLSSPTVADPVASPTSTTTYTMTACNGGTGFCCVTDQVTVTVTPNFVANAGSDITACAPSTLTIGGSTTGPAGSTYSWVETTTNSGIAISGSSSVANPTVAISAGATGSAVYTVTVVNGACTRTDAVTVTVGPLAVSAGSAQDVCAGSSITIGGAPTAPAGSTYAWTCSGAACVNLTLNSTTTANPTVTANAAATGTATYTVTATLGTCTNTSTVVVTVNPLPATPTATPSVSPICAGTSVTLTAAGGAGAGTYSWWTAATGGTQLGTGNTLAVSPTTTTTYYIQSINATTGCISARGTVTITVNLTPVANAGSDITVCAGFPVNILGTIANPAVCSPAQTWTVTSGTGTFGNANNLNTTFTPTSSGTIQLTLTPCTSGGCTAIADNMIITITPAPTVTASVTSSPVCSGLITDLNAVASGGTPNPPTITTNSFSSAAGPFNIPNNDCTTGVSIPISVTGVSNPTVGTTTVSVCVNINHNQLGNVSLILCAPGGSPCITLVPDPPGNGGPPGGSNYTNTCFTGTATTDIASGAAPYTGSFNPYGTVSMTDLNGASTNGTWTLSVLDCNGGSSGTAGQWTINFSTPVASNPYTFSWSPTIGLSSPALDNTSFFTSSFSAPATVTETVTVTDANGCIGTSSVNIDIITTPLTDAGPVQTICGTSATFAANALGVGETGVWSVVSGSGIITTPDSPTSTITGLGTGANIFQWTVTNTCGSTSDQVQITSGPDATIALSSAAGTDVQSVCASASITTITYLIGGGGTSAGGTGLPAGVTGSFAGGVFTISGTPTANGTFNYTVTTTGTCTQTTATGTIIVSALPAIPTASVTVQPTCTTPAGTIVITAPSGGTIEYSVGGAYQASGTFAGLNPGVYNVTAMDNTTGCISSITPLTVNPIPANPAAPTASVTVQPTCINTGTIVVTAPTGGTIEYSIGGAYQTSGTFTGLTPGIYDVTAQDMSTGCISVNTSLTVNAPPGAPATPTASVTFQPTCTTPTGTIVITAPSGGTIEYSVGGAYQVSGTFSGLAPGTYNVTAQDMSTGCISVFLSLTINILPANPAAPTASVTVQPTCTTPAGTIVITAPTGGTIEYSIGGAYQASGTFAGLNPGVYNVTAMDNATGCISSITPLTVNPVPANPAAPTAPSPSAYCQGAAIADLTATGTGGTLTWYSNSGLTTQVGTGSPFASGATSTSTFYVTETISGCQSLATTVIITINSTPLAPTAPSPSAYCQGAAIADLTATGSGGTFTWYSNSALTVQVGTGSPFASGATTTSTFYVTETVSGCQSLATAVTITVNPTPSAPIATSPSAYCQGAVIADLTATGTGGTLTWYSNSGLTIQVGTGSPFASGATTTSTFYVTETISGCQSLATAVIVTFDASPPTPTASVTLQPDCLVGGTIVVTSPSGGNIQYSIGGAYQSSGTFSGLSASTYYITAQNTTTTCISDDTALIVNSPPGAPAAPTASSPSAYCQGDIIADLTASGTGGTLTWYSDAGLTTQIATGSPFASGAAVTTTFYVTETTSGCQSSPTIVTITITPTPPPPTAPSPSAYCQGDTIGDLTATGTGGTLTWFGDIGLTNQLATGSPYVTGATSTSTFYVIETVSGCQSLATAVTITINSLPDIDSIPFTNESACGTPDGTITIYATGIGLLYSIDGGLTFVSSNAFTGLDIGNYTVIVENSAGCTTNGGVISISYTGNPLMPTAIANPNPTICVDSTLTLSVASPVGGETYTWYGPGAYLATGTSVSIPTITPAMGGTYSVTATNGNCISPAGTILITVNPNAVVNLTSAAGTDSQTACINTPINTITYSITGGGTGAGVTGLPAGVTGSISGGVFTISGTPTATGTFNYTLTTTGTCVQAIASGSITVNPNAAIALTSAAGTNGQVLCVNTAITSITYSITGGGTGAGVTGLPAGVTGTFSGGVFTINGTPTTSGTFNYTVTTTGTCTQAIATGSINVNPNATIALTSAVGTNTQTICINNAITTIAYSITSGGTGAGATGLPAGVTGSFAGGVFTISGAATTAGTFPYTITTTGTCVQATATGTIIINSIPLTPNASSNSPICEGSALNLTTNTVPGATYSWTGPNGFTSSTEDPIVSSNATAAMSGTYSVTVTVAGCTSPAGTTSVLVNPVPVASAGTDAMIISGSSITLTASGGGTYLWSTGEATNPITVSPTVTTEYCVTVMDVNSCSDSDCVRITVEIPCGNLFVPLAFSPNGDNENDVLSVYGDCITYLEFAIFDRWGERVFETKDPANSWDGTYKGKKLDPAVFVYYLKATIKGESVKKHGNITLTK
ncbi:MAG: hypothetical protein A3F72_01930 [Bacteroidetes bacterium RIFCSPLOWO2_12_FULL_35_15]|nr:MAG: hypothetical protein A3F72_01930 [Bacteroidetes bacterium RIFCSPLOWO2_12_FULL_35_15]